MRLTRTSWLPSYNKQEISLHGVYSRSEETGATHRWLRSVVERLLAWRLALGDPFVSSLPVQIHERERDLPIHLVSGMWRGRSQKG